MLTWFALANAAPPVLDVPFPSARLFDTPDRVCLMLKASGPATFTETRMDDFTVSCEVDNGQMSICMTLHEREWPNAVPPLSCGEGERRVLMRPVRAFDPAESIWDGVALVRDLAVLQAAYRVDHPDAAGILAGGRCGIDAGRFWFETRNPARRQTCILIVGETEREIPIRLVRQLRRQGD